MFCYWSKYRGLRDHEYPQIRSLHEAVKVYEEELSGYASVLLDEISKIYGASEKFDVRNDSYIQLNAYRGELRRVGREYLQNLHEDGHLLTLLKPNAPGLLLLVNGQEHLADVMSDQIVVMAGSLLSALTGGKVRPMYHSVLNLTHPAMRISVGYNVNDMSEARRSFTEDRMVPVGKISNENHMGFGNYRYKD
ncbi:hypothetical protein D3C78_1239820 [compost metagenome]